MHVVDTIDGLTEPKEIALYYFSVFYYLNETEN
jgi:hypothetical protein